VWTGSQWVLMHKDDSGRIYILTQVGTSGVIFNGSRSRWTSSTSIGTVPGYDNNFALSLTEDAIFYSFSVYLRKAPVSNPTSYVSITDSSTSGGQAMRVVKHSNGYLAISRRRNIYNIDLSNNFTTCVDSVQLPFSSYDMCFPIIESNGSYCVLRGNNASSAQCVGASVVAYAVPASV